MKDPITLFKKKSGFRKVSSSLRQRSFHPHGVNHVPHNPYVKHCPLNFI